MSYWGRPNSTPQLTIPSVMSSLSSTIEPSRLLYEGMLRILECSGTATYQVSCGRIAILHMSRHTRNPRTFCLGLTAAVQLKLHSYRQRSGKGQMWGSTVKSWLRHSPQRGSLPRKPFVKFKGSRRTTLIRRPSSGTIELESGSW